MFADIYRGKKVLVTGHTGFKGSWLSSWLIKLGADVAGLSDGIHTNPSLFEVLDLENQVKHYSADIRELDAVRAIVLDVQPDFVFHLAAQAIVSRSYESPIETISTNVMGTAHVLESLRYLKRPCNAVMITSDKCYENVEWEWGYRESDRLGGRDPYSGSKGAAEVAIHAYHRSFFGREDSLVKVASARAGNVIGGGDWALDRIVADCMRSWGKDERVVIRSPKATRPWQHVMEPLSGYLDLGAKLSLQPELCGEAFNFGPRAEQNHTVKELLSSLSEQWGYSSVENACVVEGKSDFHEAGLLKLNCDKALFHLKWEPVLEFAETVGFVGEWYHSYYKKDNADIYQLTLEQLAKYEQLAIERGRHWSNDKNYSGV